MKAQDVFKAALGVDDLYRRAREVWGDDRRLRGPESKLNRELGEIATTWASRALDTLYPRSVGVFVPATLIPELALKLLKWDGHR